MGEKDEEGFLGFDLEKKNRSEGNLVSTNLGVLVEIKWGEMLEPSENIEIKG